MRGAVMSYNPTNPGAVIQDLESLGRDLSPQNVPLHGVITLNAGSRFNGPFNAVANMATGQKNRVDTVKFGGPTMYIDLLKFLSNYQKQNGNFNSLTMGVTRPRPNSKPGSNPNEDKKDEKEQQRLKRIKAIATEAYLDFYRQEEEKKQKMLNGPDAEKATATLAKQIAGGGGFTPFDIVRGAAESASKNTKTAPGSQTNTASGVRRVLSAALDPRAALRPSGFEEKK